MTKYEFFSKLSSLTEAQLKKPDLLDRLLTKPAPIHNEDDCWTFCVHPVVNDFIKESDKEGKSVDEITDEILAHSYWKKLLKNNDRSAVKKYVTRLTSKTIINGSATQKELFSRSELYPNSIHAMMGNGN